jgi:hypothetical protein
MTSVLQDWVQNLTFMQQTVLLTAVRGPDNIPKYGPTKYLLRWYRRCILRSSLDNGMVIDNPWRDDVGGSFMGPSITRSNSTPYLYTFGAQACGSDRDTWEDAMDDVVSSYLREVDALPHHFQLHFMHAVEIVGYKHPGTLAPGKLPAFDTDYSIPIWWSAVYRRLVHDMHLHPETKQEMDRRLGDSRDQWLERADVATVK